MPKRQSPNRQLVQSGVNLPVNRRKIEKKPAIDDLIEVEIDESEFERPKRKKGWGHRGRPVKEAPFSLPEPLEDMDDENFTQRTNKAIGSTIRKIRLEKGLTLKMVYESAGLNRNYYGLLELGRVTVSVVNLAKIARAMRTTLKGLVEKIED